MTPYEYFTDKDRESFNGFDIFESEDGYQLQIEDDEDVFKNDYEAWAFIWGRSQKGSDVHQKIIDFIRQENIEEYRLLSKDIFIDKIKEF